MHAIKNIEDVKKYLADFLIYKSKATDPVTFDNLSVCENLAQQHNEKSLLIRSRIHLTEYFIQVNDLQSALNIALINKQMAETENLKEEELNCYSGLLNIYYLLGDYSSLEELIQAYREKLLDSNDLKKLCSLYIISAIQHYTLKDYKKCMEANEKALEYALQINNPVLLTHVYNNYGYHAINVDLDLAHDLLFKCMKLIKSSNKKNNTNLYSLAAVNTNLAELYFKQNAYKLCNKCLDIAINILKSINNKNVLLVTQNRLSELFIHSEKFSAAKKLLNHIEEECIATNNKSTLLRCYFHYYTLFEKTKKYKPAYEYLLKYQVLNDELFNEESNLKIRNLQIANEVNSIKRQRDHAERIAHLKHDFLANMSHEIRTPINSVLGICYLMQQENLTEKQQDYIYRLERSGHNLLGLINEILDLSKIEAGKLELVTTTFSFNSILSDTIQSMQQKADEKNIKLSFNKMDELDKPINGDPLRLSQILLNLISNAIKFTPKGKVQVDTSISENNHHSFLISCRIKDSGIGIPEDKIQTIFERYEQASASIKTQFGGTGLGLAITKKLVELMNGNIIVQSKLNKGTTFTVQLPFEKTHTEEVTPAVKHTDTSFLNGLDIIIADDIEENRLVTKDVLLHFNSTLKIREAENGKQVLNMIEEKSPDIILMDLDMPEMNGFESMGEIRKKKIPNHISIIANTAGLLTLTREEIITIGFDGLLFKPFKPTDLLHILSVVMKKNKNKTKIKPQILG